MGKSNSDRSRLASNLLVAGLLLWFVSWFTPATRLFGPLGSQGNAWAQSLGNLPPKAAEAAMAGPEWLPGWAACRASFHMLVNEPNTSDNKSTQRRLAGSSCLSNLGMLAALLLLATRSAPRILGGLLIGCTALNASWLYLYEGNPFAFLRAGYFFWLVSFPLTGLGILLLPRRARS